MENIVQAFSRKNKWAVVGVSENKNKFGYKIYCFLRDNTNFLVYPVNPRVAQIDGRRCYSSLSDIPEKPDVVNFVVPPGIVSKVAREGMALGINYYWLQPGSEDEETITWLKNKGATVISNACVMREL